MFLDNRNRNQTLVQAATCGERTWFLKFLKVMIRLGWLRVKLLTDDIYNFDTSSLPVPFQIPLDDSQVYELFQYVIVLQPL
jgi:hypothetical protein